MTISLPVLNCDGCGVCCGHVATPPGFAAFFPPAGHPQRVAKVWRGTPDHLIVQSMPADVRASCRAGFDEAWRTNRSAFDVPCFWYDPQTRRCRHHEHRPTVCREFEVGGEDCLRLRAERLPLRAGGAA